MRTLFLIGILSITGCAHQDEWTSRDTYMQLAVSAVIVADAVTTSRIKDCSNCWESGPIATHVLGRQPEEGETFIYFGSLIVMNYLVSRALPAKWRPYWQTWEFVIHTAAVVNNCKRGLC